MNILVTGAEGFVGKNLCAALKNSRDGKDRTHPGLTIDEIYLYDTDSAPEELDTYVSCLLKLQENIKKQLPCAQCAERKVNQ